jgi:glucokinase
MQFQVCLNVSKPGSDLSKGKVELHKLMNLTTFLNNKSVNPSIPSNPLPPEAPPGIIAHMSTFVAVDIGGTHIRAAAYETDNITPLTHERTRSHAQQPGTFDRLVKVIEAAWPQDRNITAIGMASPGPLDPNTGVVLATPNIPEWINFPLTEKLSAHFGVPAYLDNDANLGALGEWKFGAGKGHHDVLYLTISTGIGGGVIIDDRLLHGYHGLAAELGHVIVLAGGPVCSCGYKGHLEALAAGPAIVRYVREQLDAGKKSELSDTEELNARLIAEAAERGDNLAKSAYARAGEYLGIGVASFLHTFDPSVVIFGGGVSQSGPLLFDPFEISLHKHVFNPHYLEKLVITKAALGDDAGLLGALALAQMASD